MMGERSKFQFLSAAAIVIGAVLLGVEYGWKVGLGVGLIAWALLPPVYAD